MRKQIPIFKYKFLKKNDEYHELYQFKIAYNFWNNALNKALLYLGTGSKRTKETDL